MKSINQFNSVDEPPAESEPLSKSAMKNKRKRDAKKSKQQNAISTNYSNEQQDALKMASYLLKESDQPTNVKPALDETEKKIKNLRKKLQAIEKLKLQQVQGKVLEKNQLEKLNTEQKLMEELGKLTAS